MRAWWQKSIGDGTVSEKESPITNFMRRDLCSMNDACINEHACNFLLATLVHDIIIFSIYAMMPIPILHRAQMHVILRDSLYFVSLFAKHHESLIDQASEEVDT